MQIIIVAGGGGSRLWPLSTPLRPKQFIPIVNNTSSLQKVYSYVSAEFSKDCIWINTNENYKNLVAQTLVDFPLTHILTEPEKRDNFAAVAVQAAILANKFGDEEPLIFTTSDEFFESVESSQKFVKALQRIGDSLSANEYDIVTMGVKATSPNINYGYVEIQTQNIDSVYSDVVPATKFAEKPTAEIAQTYLEAGNYVWNKFNPSFTYKTLKRIIESHYPALAPIFQSIRESGICTSETYQTIPKVSFEYAIMEKSDSMGITALDVDDWIDVGNWEQAFKYLPNESDNILQIQASDNKLLSSTGETKQVSFVGVDNLLVVETDDKILIINPEYSKYVKDVAEHFESQE